MNRQMDLELKKLYQKEYEKEHTRNDFINLIGQSYLQGDLIMNKLQILVLIDCFFGFKVYGGVRKWKGDLSVA